MNENFDCSKLTAEEIKQKAKDMNIIFDAAEKQKEKERNFDRNVELLVKRFKDDAEGLEKMMESLQKTIDDNSEISESPETTEQKKEQAMYEMETCVEAYKKIKSEQK